MTMPVRLVVTAALMMATPLLAQTSNDPFPSPISATEGVLRVNFTWTEPLMDQATADAWIDDVWKLFTQLA